MALFTVPVSRELFKPSCVRVAPPACGGRYVCTRVSTMVTIARSVTT